jgi:hypothetical protein
MFRLSGLPPRLRRVRVAALLITGLAITILSSGILPGDAARRAGDELLQTVIRVAAPVVASWIIENRDALAPDGAPVPTDIAEQIEGYFSQTRLDRARHHVGWPGGLAGLVFRLTGMRAIAFDHVIVFRNQTIAADPVIWAHELAHTRQFETWGVTGFVERYLRDHEGVEMEAWQVAIDYKMWALQTGRLE